MRALLAVGLVLVLAAPAAADTPPGPDPASACSLDTVVANCSLGVRNALPWSADAQDVTLSSGLATPVTWTGPGSGSCSSMSASCTVSFRQDTVGDGAWQIVRATSGNDRKYFPLFMESRWHRAEVKARDADGTLRSAPGTLFAIKDGADPQSGDCTDSQTIETAQPTIDPATITCIKVQANVSGTEETGPGPHPSRTWWLIDLPSGSAWSLHTGNAQIAGDPDVPTGIASAPRRWTTSAVAMANADLDAAHTTSLKPLPAGDVTLDFALGTPWLIYDTNTTATLTMTLHGGEGAVYGFWEDGNGLRLKDTNKPQNQATDTVDITEPSGLANQFVLSPGQSRSVTYSLHGTLTGLAKLVAGAKWNAPGTTLYSNLGAGPRDLEIFYADDNTKVASLTVKKVVLPSTDSAFPFTLAHAGGATTPFTVPGGGQQAYSLPPSGAYTLTEGAFGGFSLQGGAPSCETDAPDKVSFGAATSGTTITFADNAGAPHVSCTFTNVADGTAAPGGGADPTPTPGGPAGNGTPTPTPKKTATIKVKVPKKLKPNKKFSIGVTVSAPGTTPTGSVTLAKGKTSIGTIALAKGKAAFKLKLNAGTSKLKVSYAGSTTVTSATKTLTVKIKKKKKKQH